MGDFGASTFYPFAVYANGGVLQGVMTMTNAGVVAIVAFAGMHWSQHESHGREEILYGTIVDTVDEMCDWETHNEQLARFKVSDTPGSNSVYGVFVDWNDGGPDADDFPDDGNIMSVGAFVIRIAAGEEIKNGDLIESDGNGCGRVQADNIMRASTVAKITSTTHRAEYDDGSFVVPCTLHCG